MQFLKHYTVEQARELLPLIREWLAQIEKLEKQLEFVGNKFSYNVRAGHDMGGETVNQFARILADTKATLAQFTTREIRITDLKRGLIDFPSMRAGREVFLCWEKDEEDIEFWHDLDAGYAGRDRL